MKRFLRLNAVAGGVLLGTALEMSANGVAPFAFAVGFSFLGIFLNAYHIFADDPLLEAQRSDERWYVLSGEDKKPCTRCGDDYGPIRHPVR